MKRVWLTMLAIVLAGCSGSSTGSEGIWSEWGGDPLRPGDCLTNIDGQTVGDEMHFTGADIVSCNEPHLYEVVTTDCAALGVTEDAGISEAMVYEAIADYADIAPSKVETWLETQGYGKHALVAGTFSSPECFLALVVAE